MIDILESDSVRVAATGERNEPGHENALVVLALDQTVNGLAVGANSRYHNFAVLVAERLRLVRSLSTALNGQLERRARVVDPKRDVFHAVAGLVDVTGNLAVGPKRGRQNDPDSLP